MARPKNPTSELMTGAKVLLKDDNSEVTFLYPRGLLHCVVLNRRDRMECIEVDAILGIPKPEEKPDGSGS